MENLNNNVKGEFQSIRLYYTINVNLANVLKIDIEYSIVCHINNNKIVIDWEVSDYTNLIFMDTKIEKIMDFFTTQETLGIDFREMIIEEAGKIDIEAEVRNDYKNLFDFMVQNNIK